MTDLARRDLRRDDLERHQLFPRLARQVRQDRAPQSEQSCSMCGDF